MTTIFDPIKIGNVEIKNRMAFAPMLTNFASPDGFVTQKMINHYVERAKGGVGMITVEVHFISPTSRVYRPNPGGVPLIDEDTHIPSLRELAAAIKSNGARAFLQIAHMGKYGIPGGRVLVPSAINPPLADSFLGTTRVLEEMSEETIRRIIHEYAQAARRVKEAGFDGVTIHATHGFLPQQFMSPYSNLRKDRYGQDRLLFCEELIQTTKNITGKDFPLIMRISGDEFLKDIGQKGFTVEDMKEIAPRLERAGADALDISAGTVDNPYWLVQPSYFPRGVILHLAEAVKKVVKIPVLGVGRINTPEVAISAISEGKCDLVNLGRALIADPEFPKKLIEGRYEEIRKCIACNYCLFTVGTGYITCSVNPELGFEEEYKIRKRSPENRKKVLVIGGGPGGMEAARVAALRGNEVFLCEKEEELGGQLNLADKAPGKEEIRNIKEYLISQIKKLGVKIYFGREVTPEFIDELKPDAIILATGATPTVPKIPGIDKPLVVTAGDVLLGKVETGSKVAVIGGELVGCEVADYLLEKGKEVTVLRRGPQMAMNMEPLTRIVLLQRLQSKKAKLIPNIHYKEITEEGIIIRYPDGREELIRVDTIVIAAGANPNRDLAKKIMGKTYDPPYEVGDCVTPRRIVDAIHEGSRAARRI